MTAHTTSWHSYFKGKKITVMGLGLLGRGVGDIRFLAEMGAKVLVTDLKSKEALASSIKELKEFKNVKYVLGQHRLEDFQHCDLVLKAAGVPLNSPYIREAETHGIPVVMSTALFAKLSGVATVGVTGTRGKSTTTHLIYEILKHAGMDALLGGNVKGVSTLAQLHDVGKDTIAVLELDSWQLQGFGTEGLSPNVSVFTTFYPDHLNYYDGDLDQYLDDKAQIFLHQTPEDTLIVGEQCESIIQKKYGKKIQSRVVVAKASALPKSWKINIPGKHNRANIACAVAAARALGVDDSVIQEAVEAYKGVSGRLELVKESNGVKIYNDTTATTPEATLVAIKALSEEGKKNIVLIMGGADKGLNMSELLQEVQERCKKVILLAGTGTDNLKMAFPASTIYEALEPAVLDAFASATSGDAILFSPGFASFGMFKNEFDRGDQFIAIVSSLK